MVVGFTIWGERISPVFDSSHMLLVAVVQDSTIISKRIEPFDPLVPFLLSEKLKELNIDVLVCGAISIEPSLVVQSAGISLIPFISGKVETILDEFTRGESLSGKYLMPGCSENRQKK